MRKASRIRHWLGARRSQRCAAPDPADHGTAFGLELSLGTTAAPTATAAPRRVPRLRRRR
jgi:hypothetical protein